MCQVHSHCFAARRYDPLMHNSIKQKQARRLEAIVHFKWFEPNGFLKTVTVKENTKTSSVWKVCHFEPVEIRTELLEENNDGYWSTNSYTFRLAEVDKIEL